MFAIFESRNLRRPYEFQDQEAGTQTPAVFRDQKEAEDVCDKMNYIAHVSHFIVKECPKGWLHNGN